MAVKTKGRGEPAAKPRNDAYTGLLAISFLSMVGACVLLYLDYSDYEAAKGPPTKFDLQNIPKQNQAAPAAQQTKNDPAPVDPMNPAPVDPMNPAPVDPMAPMNPMAPMAPMVAPPPMMMAVPKSTTDKVQAPLALPPELTPLTPEVTLQSLPMPTPMAAANGTPEAIKLNLPPLTMPMTTPAPALLDLPDPVIAPPAPPAALVDPLVIPTAATQPMVIPTPMPMKQMNINDPPPLPRQLFMPPM